MDRIFNEIRDSVAKEAEQLVSRAERVAEREKEHARREAEAIITAYRDKARRDAQTREERVRAHRIIETRKHELSQRQAFVDTIFSPALAAVSSVYIVIAVFAIWALDKAVGLKEFLRSR